MHPRLPNWNALENDRCVPDCEVGYELVNGRCIDCPPGTSVAGRCERDVQCALYLT